MFSLFSSNGIKVRLINNRTNESVGTIRCDQEDLPESFSQPTTITFENKEWRVVKADPVDSQDFTLEKKLTLWVEENEVISLDDIRYSLPTISNESPALIPTKPQDGFSITLHEDDWRQIEFLPLTLLPVIQEEMKEVEAILFPEKEDDRLGFDSIHVRTKIGTQHLSIEFEDFCREAGIIEKGFIEMENFGDKAFVKNGFAFRSANHTYYGTEQDGMIKELCLASYESPDTELMDLCDKYKLALVIWCRGQITTV